MTTNHVVNAANAAICLEHARTVFFFGVLVGLFLSSMIILIFWQEARKWKRLIRRMMPSDPLERMRFIRDLSAED